MSKYIEFNLIRQKPKTEVYMVRNIKSQEILGGIHWHAPWRQYIFATAPGCIFSMGCLKDIIDFIKELENKRAAGPSK